MQKNHKTLPTLLISVQMLGCSNMDTCAVHINVNAININVSDIYALHMNMNTIHVVHEDNQLSANFYRLILAMKLYRELVW